MAIIPTRKRAKRTPPTLADQLYPEDSPQGESVDDEEEGDAPEQTGATRSPMQKAADSLYPQTGQDDAEDEGEDDTGETDQDADDPDGADQEDDGDADDDAADEDAQPVDKSKAKAQPKDKPGKQKLPESETVRTPTQEEWDSIVDVGGSIPKLVRDNKLLYGYGDKEYEKLTGIKNGISEFQRRLGIKVTGIFDKRTYFAARDAFVSMILPWAEKAEKEWRVPVQVTVGQALLESSWGLSTPTDVDNKERSQNLYGVKAKAGDYYVTAPTQEQDKETKKYYQILGDFKSYEDYEDSVMGHARFLHDGTPTFRHKYPDYDAMTRSGDIALWAKGLHLAGYATESDYENRLLNSMKVSDRIIRELKARGK